jgi:hypothetical protein
VSSTAGVALVLAVISAKTLFCIFQPGASAFRSNKCVHSIFAYALHIMACVHVTPRLCLRACCCCLCVAVLLCALSLLLLLLLLLLQERDLTATSTWQALAPKYSAAGVHTRMMHSCNHLCTGMCSREAVLLAMPVCSLYVSSDAHRPTQACHQSPEVACTADKFDLQYSAEETCKFQLLARRHVSGVCKLTVTHILYLFFSPVNPPPLLGLTACAIVAAGTGPAHESLVLTIWMRDGFWTGQWPYKGSQTAAVH